MKKLSDYKDEEAVELWADLLDDIVLITSDEKIANIYRDKTKTIVQKATAILKIHPKETVRILKRIDPTEIDGVTIVVRIVDLLLEIENHPELKAFF